MSQDAHVETWLGRLRAEDPAALTQALHQWPRAPLAATAVAAPVWRAVERLALHGPTPQVQAAAREALTSPAARRFYASHTTWPPVSQRARLRAEIQRWAQEGLVTPAQAAVLQARYADPPPARPAADEEGWVAVIPPEQPAPRRASPWALHIVLYLGAFFVISAALLFAALVEAWRLPILLAATLLFGAAAAGVYRVTPTGGRVLGIVAAGFLWADAAVLADLLRPYLSPTAQDAYWAAATLLLAVLWLVTGFLLRSAVLTLAAWPMLAAAPIFGLNVLDDVFAAVRLSWLFAAWAGEVLLAGLWAAWLRARQPGPARGLWGTAHLVAGLLVWTIVPLAALDADDTARVNVWLPVLVAHGLLLAFCLLTRWRVRPLPWVEAWAVPLNGLGMTLAWVLLWPAGAARALAWSLAGVGWAAAAVGVRRWSWGMPRAWGLALELLAGLAWWLAGFALAGDTALPGHEAWALLPWLVGAAWGWTAAWVAARVVTALWGWVLGLSAFVQFVAQVWPGTVGVYWPGWLLLPLLGSVALDALAGRFRRPVVRFVARGGAGVLAVVVGLQALADVGMARPRTAGVLLALTLLLAGYAWALRRAWLWAGVPLLALFTWGLALDALDAYHPAALAAWPTLAAVVTWAVARRGPTPAWQAWGWGVLGAAWFTAALALFYTDGWSVLALATMATVTGGFAWLWHPLALAVPTAALYFAAYAWTLHLWDVRQPQGYTVPAAALGLLLHGLYRRRGHTAVAFVLGALSQLVLFTTTYIQMVDQRSGLYFAVLFLQALVVLGYGLWSNDPALIWTPVGFVVLATVTLVLIRFQGLGVLALLCFSGLVLLAGGLFVLWQRTRREAAADSDASRPDAPRPPSEEPSP